MGTKKSGYKVNAYFDEGELHIEGIEVSHPSHVNENLRTYPNAKKKVKTFTEPFNIPVLAFHDDWRVIGYVKNAYYRRKSLIDPEYDAVVADIVITDDDAIDGFKKKLYRTFSVGMSRDKSVCSICGSPTGECEHDVGKEYEGKICYEETYIKKYLELSVSPVPADEMAYIPLETFKSISDSTISLDESAEILHDNINIEFSPKKKKKKTGQRVNDSITINIVEDENNNGGNIMTEIDKLIKQITEIGISKDFLDVFLVDFSGENQLELLTKMKEMLDDFDNPDFFINYAWDNDIDKELFESGAFLDIDDEDDTEEDKKVPPAGSKARKKMKTQFCGPNKTFPMTDCKHAAVALAMLKWPKVAAKYKGQIKKIRACIYKWGKKHNCTFAQTKKDGAENVDASKTTENTSPNLDTSDIYKTLIEYGKTVQELQHLRKEYDDLKNKYDALIEDDVKKDKIIDKLYSIFDKDGLPSDIEDSDDMIDYIEGEAFKKIVDSIIEGGVEDDVETDVDKDENETEESKKKDIPPDEVSKIVLEMLENKVKSN